MENPGENFLSRAHKSHPPKSGGKLWREKCSHSQITKMPSLSQWSQQLNKEEEDNFPMTNSAQPNYHHRNPKITQNQPIFIIIIIMIIFSLPCSFRTIKKEKEKKERDAET